MSPEEERVVKIGTIWLPLGMALSVAGVLIWFTWTAQSERLNIHNRIDSLANTVKILSESVERIATRIGQPDTDSITRQQWLVECLQLQIANPGWKCPYGANSMIMQQPARVAQWATTLVDGRTER